MNVELFYVLSSCVLLISESVKEFQWGISCLEQ